MLDELKEALKPFYIEKRKEAYIEEYKSKHEKLPTPNNIQKFLELIVDSDLERDVEEGIKKYKPLLEAKRNTFWDRLVPSGLCSAILGTSLAFLLVLINHIGLVTIPIKVLTYFLNVPMLIVGITSLLTSIFLLYKTIK